MNFKDHLKEQALQNQSSSKLVTAVDLLAKKLDGLRNDFFNDLKGGNVKKYVCTDCRNENMQSYIHCFKCGPTNHIGKTCRKGQGQGN